MTWTAKVHLRLKSGLSGSKIISRFEQTFLPHKSSMLKNPLEIVDAIP